MLGLKDVAKFAGVSASTVSRVLAGKTYVNADTRERVMEAVRTLKYRPNALARGLKGGSTKTIALMIPSIENEIFPHITRGVEDAARKAGYTVILCNTDEDSETEKEYIEKLRMHLIDGFIVASAKPDSDHILKLCNQGFPVVLTNRSLGDMVDAVVIDNIKAGYDATKLLISTGHKSIAIALGRIELPIYAERLAGYRKALEECGLVYDEKFIIHEGEGNRSFYSSVRELLDRGIKPDAIFATSDPKAFVVMRALHDAGLRIPEDVSVIGLDNVEMSSLVEPPLTTISQPLYEIGRVSAQKLFKLIASKEKSGELTPPRIDVLQTELIIRRSTK